MYFRPFVFFSSCQPPSWKHTWRIMSSYFIFGYLSLKGCHVFRYMCLLTILWYSLFLHVWLSGLIGQIFGLCQVSGVQDWVGRPFKDTIFWPQKLEGMAKVYSAYRKSMGEKRSKGKNPGSNPLRPIFCLAFPMKGSGFLGMYHLKEIWMKELVLKPSSWVFNLCWLLTLLPDCLLRSVPGTLPNSRWSALSVDRIRHTQKKIRVTHGQKGSLLFGIFCLNALSAQEDMFKNSNVVTLWLVTFSIVDTLSIWDLQWIFKARFESTNFPPKSK